MKKVILILLLTFIATTTSYSKPTNDDLTPDKMTKVASEILDLFTSPDQDKLRDYISESWLKKEDLEIKDYTINSYYPDDYFILWSTSNIVIVEIGGEEWKHLLIFKFVDEDGIYRVIPKGLSMGGNDYIDPWWDVREYICREKDDLIEEKQNFDK
ncbi:MAG: hypothetical protein H8D45_30570 [Bacteroidetes bacterium]|nr:hypothetical protein [Bacteroidota bacterium]